jgi:hypothetical protein
LPFQPLEFLEVARNLASSGSEACFRTAVGRAYFGIAMEAWVKMFGDRTSKVNHKKIEKASKQAGTTAHEHFKTLLRLRVEADYYTIPSDSDYSNWEKNWETADALATELLPKINRFSAR